MATIDLHANRAEADAHTAGRGATAGGGCSCGGHDETMPELDVQTIPHAVRHAAIFGAVESLRPGGGLILSATHDPVPLLQQLAQRHPDAFDVAYLERGPERWRIRIVRRAADAGSDQAPSGVDPRASAHTAAHTSDQVSDDGSDAPIPLPA